MSPPHGESQRSWSREWQNEKLSRLVPRRKAGRRRTVWSNEPMLGPNMSLKINVSI